MISRISFAAIVLFWLTMNVLLWRGEVSHGDGRGSPVPLDGVMERLLTSPDPATLEVHQNGKAVGFVHWYPDPGEEPNRVFSGDYVPDGMVKSARGLLVRLDGVVSPTALGTRLHLDLEVRLSHDRTWESFTLQVGTRTTRATLRAVQVEQVLEWRIAGPEAVLEDRIDLSRPLEPNALLKSLAGPLAGVAAGPWLNQVPRSEEFEGLMRAEAEMDWMPLGSSKVRIYRIRLRLAEKHEATLLVNRAGEILRIELPGGWKLINKGLFDM
jgi:hypothetical protein